MAKELLMVFVKNPVEGKVKTRLAKTMGAEKAFKIYLQLLEHTHHVSKGLAVDKAVFYSDEILTGDVWDHGNFQKYKQEGSDLGKRMFNAFKLAFSKNTWVVLKFISPEELLAKRNGGTSSAILKMRVEAFLSADF